MVDYSKCQVLKIWDIPITDDEAGGQVVTVWGNGSKHHLAIVLRLDLKRKGARMLTRRFICPACGRLRRTLYLPVGEDHFGCRQCYHIRYDTHRLMSGKFRRQYKRQRMRCPSRK